jgi:hypothetical protein
MTFKFPGSDRFTGRGKEQEQPKTPDDIRAIVDKANKTLDRLAKGRKIAPMPRPGPLSDSDRKSVVHVVEELTGQKVRGRVNDPEVGQRLGRLFGGSGPAAVRNDGPDRPPPERPPVSRQGGQSRVPPRF